MSALNETKKLVLEHLLPKFTHVLVVVVGTMDRVVLPPAMLKQNQVALSIGCNLPIPIPDLVIDATGICCTLSFNHAPFKCSVPWECVCRMVTSEGHVVWLDAAQQNAPEKLPVTPPVKPGLRLIDGGKN